MKQFSTLGIGILLLASAALTAHKTTAQPALPTEEEIAEEATKEFRQRREDKSRAAFGDWRYPGDGHSDVSGGDSLFTLDAVTTDDIEKVWNYYADKAQMQESHGAAAKKNSYSKEGPYSKQVPWQSPKAMNFSSSYKGPQESSHTTLYLPPLPRNHATIVSHKNGETFVITLSRVAPEEKTAYRTRIHLIRVAAPQKPPVVAAITSPAEPEKPQPKE